VVIVREKKEMTVQVTVALRESEEALFGGRQDQRDTPRPQENQEVKSDLGLTVRPSSEANTPGVEVSAVAPGSAAEDAGLRPGDIITRMGGEVIRDLASFRTAQGKVKPNTSVVLRVLTQGPNGRQPRIVVVRPQP
jgi:S1-C subfamily serine protease